ncbi:hypothetical protein BC828DRAFT_375640 [Blastocladiella britannica]|nr:hypothetical protein BC828DRAFT_375640 [Blastocladiella britannica]
MGTSNIVTRRAAAALVSSQPASDCDLMPPPRSTRQSQSSRRSSDSVSAALSSLTEEDTTPVEGLSLSPGTVKPFVCRGCTRRWKARSGYFTHLPTCPQPWSPLEPAISDVDDLDDEEDVELAPRPAADPAPPPLVGRSSPRIARMMRTMTSSPRSAPTPSPSPSPTPSGASGSLAVSPRARRSSRRIATSSTIATAVSTTHSQSPLSSDDDSAAVLPPPVTPVGTTSTDSSSFVRIAVPMPVKPTAAPRSGSASTSDAVAADRKKPMTRSSAAAAAAAATAIPSAATDSHIPTPDSTPASTPIVGGGLKKSHTLAAPKSTAALPRKRVARKSAVASTTALALELTPEPSSQELTSSSQPLARSSSLSLSAPRTSGAPSSSAPSSQPVHLSPAIRSNMRFACPCDDADQDEPAGEFYPCDACDQAKAHSVCVLSSAQLASPAVPRVWYCAPCTVSLMTPSRRRARTTRTAVRAPIFGSFGKVTQLRRPITTVRECPADVSGTPHYHDAAVPHAPSLQGSEALLPPPSAVVGAWRPESARALVSSRPAGFVAIQARERARVVGFDAPPVRASPPRATLIRYGATTRQARAAAAAAHSQFMANMAEQALHHTTALPAFFSLMDNDENAPPLSFGGGRTSMATSVASGSASASTTRPSTLDRHGRFLSLEMSLISSPVLAAMNDVEPISPVMDEFDEDHHHVDYDAGAENVDHTMPQPTRKRFRRDVDPPLHPADGHDEEGDSDVVAITVATATTVGGPSKRTRHQLTSMRADRQTAMGVDGPPATPAQRRDAPGVKHADYHRSVAPTPNATPALGPHGFGSDSWVTETPDTSLQQWHESALTLLSDTHTVCPTSLLMSSLSSTPGCTDAAANELAMTASWLSTPAETPAGPSADVAAPTAFSSSYHHHHHHPRHHHRHQLMSPATPSGGGSHLFSTPTPAAAAAMSMFGGGGAWSTPVEHALDAAAAAIPASHLAANMYSLGLGYPPGADLVYQAQQQLMAMSPAAVAAAAAAAASATTTATVGSPYSSLARSSSGSSWGMSMMASANRAMTSAHGVFAPPSSLIERHSSDLGSLGDYK